MSCKKQIKQPTINIHNMEMKLHLNVIKAGTADLI